MFLKNAWYAAGWSDDLPAGTPIARTYLNEPVVLYRLPDGIPVALEDRCCHRAAPLSLGECIGDHLVCGYHGLRFDATGTCVQIPGQSAIPPGAAVRSYPLCERHNMVWIWMGEADRADEATIPDYFWLDDPGWVAARGVLPMKGHYQLLIDNLLDFTHVTYIHRNTIAGEPAEGTVPVKLERLEDGVKIARWMIDFDPPPLFAAAGGFTGKVDRWQIATWKAPATLAFDVGCAVTGSGAPDGDRSQGISIWSTHLITPETETSTHYHWAFVRNFALEDENMTKLLHNGAKLTFEEDVDIIEAQQRRLGGITLDGLIDINADAPQLQMRRMMDEMIAAERTVADATLAEKKRT